MPVELLTSNDEFDHNKFEIEKKLVPRTPDLFIEYKADALPIEQIYLSHSTEPYSLRLRETTTAEGTTYSATLKDRGNIRPNGLLRREIETPINADTYHYYAAQSEFPRLKKLRATLAPGVTVDWYQHRATPIIEIEHIGTNLHARHFYEEHAVDLIDVTSHEAKMADNEHIAHEISGCSSIESFKRPNPTDITANILETYSGSPLVITLAGRSGSGKTTIARETQHQLVQHGLSVRLLSTDDYHRGKKWLETNIETPWTNWDLPIVYDTVALAIDLWRLRTGKPIIGRQFNFTSEEPESSTELLPADVILVEGIHGDSPDLDGQRNLHIAIDTPFATSLGCRLNRDGHEASRLNSSLPRQEDILKFMIETAEPTYREKCSQS